MAPAPMRKYHGVLAGPSGEVIREAVGVACSVGGVVHEGMRSLRGDADEVDEVVAGEGEGKGEGAHEDDDFEDVDFEPVEYLHQYGEEYEKDGDEHPCVFLYPVFIVGGHERTVFQTFDEHEVDDGGCSDAAEEGDAVFHLFL